MSTDNQHRKQFERYLNGEMSQEETNAFERATLDDPFAQEAMEGLEAHGIDGLNDLPKIEKKLSSHNKKGMALWKYLGIAATLLIGMTFVFYTFNQFENASEIAMEEQVGEKELSSFPKTDTVPVKKEKQIVENEMEDEIKSESTSTQLAEIVEEKEEDQLYDIVEEESKRPSIPTNSDFSISKVQTEIPKQSHKVAAAEESIVTSSPQVKSFADEQSKLALQEEEGAVNQALRSEKMARMNVTDAVSGSDAGAPITMYIAGRVTDEFGEPLPGVNVIIKGTTTGTNTDQDGNYQLESVKDITLVFTYVGFDTQEIDVSEQDKLDVVMGGTSELQKLVVTAQPLVREKKALDYALSSAEEESTIGDDEIYWDAGIMDVDKAKFYHPEPSIGWDKYRLYLQEELKYPREAKRKEIDGKVFVEAKVSSDGKIVETKVVRGIGYGCDKEALRLVNEGPNFTADSLNRRGLIIIRVDFKIE